MWGHHGTVGLLALRAEGSSGIWVKIPATLQEWKGYPLRVTVPKYHIQSHSLGGSILALINLENWT